MKFVVGSLVAVASAVIVSIGAAFSVGSLNFTIAVSALLIGLVVGSFAATRVVCESKWPKITYWGWATILVGVLFALRAFCWLIFFDDDKINVLSPNNLGDMSLHLTYINNLASGASFWPDNPIFSGSKLHYPIGIDLFNSLLSLIGVNIYRGLIWVGLFGCLISGIALYRWGGTFGLAAFLFNGGIASYGLLNSNPDWVFLPGIFKDFLLRDYQADMAWKSFPLAMLNTQRGLLFALPAGLVLLTTWSGRFFPEALSPHGFRIPPWLEIFLYSTMPLFHFHTFFFLSALLAYWMVVATKQTRIQLVKLIRWSLLPSTFWICLTTGLFIHSSSPHAVPPVEPGINGIFNHWFASHSLPVHMKPGWMQEDLPFFEFWFNNFGLLPLFVLGLVTVLILRSKTSRQHRESAALVFPAVLLFLFCCFVMLAPWEWDNTKVMIWSYLVVMPFIWTLVIRHWPSWLRVLACFVLFSSGFVSLLGGIDGTHQGYEIGVRSELDGLSKAVKNIPVHETFATFPTWNHPLLLIGRKVAVGYVGHLRSHGIDYEAQEASLNLLMTGGPEWKEAAKHLQTRYLFWGRLEKEGYKDSSMPWKEQCPLVASGSWGELYDLNQTIEATAPAEQQQSD